MRKRKSKNKYKLKSKRKNNEAQKTIIKNPLNDFKSPLLKCILSNFHDLYTRKLKCIRKEYHV